MKKDNGAYKDDVNHPDHYTRGIEVIDYINSWSMDWNRANVIKYVTRAPYKGNPIKDLKKARFYIDNLIKRLDDGEIPNSSW
tara:strand:+ start:2441 stop:2686 length:246 start_codon:yes stop_codon:yes gene_type:complete